MSSKPQFIDGIHNYCDRWCERCDRTAVCRVFYDEQKSRRRRKRRGEDGGGIEADLKDVSRSFRKAGRLMARYAKAHNLDLNEIKSQAARDEIRYQEFQIGTHPLVLEAEEYAGLVPPLLDMVQSAFNAARDETADHAAFMDVKHDVTTLKAVRDACEVLAWDWPLVQVKARRMMNSWFKAANEAGEEADEDSREFHRHDAEMTADLVRRCLQRDKLALLSLYEWDEQFQSAAIDLLVKAERLIRGIEKQE